MNEVIEKYKVPILLVIISIAMLSTYFMGVTNARVNVNPVINDLKILSRNNLDCYWATQYVIDYEGTIEHFKGQDYSKEYIEDCIINTNENWEIIERWN